MSIIDFLNLKATHAEIADYKTVNSESLIDFFDVMMEKYSGGDKIHVILDNDPANISKNTRNEAEKRITLSSISCRLTAPNLNPIEHLWKLIHELARNNKFFLLVRDFRESIFRFFNITWHNISSSASSRINDHSLLLSTPAFSF